MKTSMTARTLPMLFLVAVVASCAWRDSGSPECADGPSTVVVHAASSLREGFEALVDGFADAVGCGTDIVFEFGSSRALAARIVAGSPAAVFVAAGSAPMEVVVGAGAAVGVPVDFLANDASLMVSSRSERRDMILTIEDLLADGVLAGLCVATAPCGSLADEVLGAAAASIDPRIGRSSVADTEAMSSADLITKISLGELDAGIVFSSECGADAADTLCRELPDAINSTTVYTVVALVDGGSARRLVDAIRSTTVTDRLADEHGFTRLIR